MKKIYAILIMLMIGAFAFAGASDEQATSGLRISAPGQFPIVDETFELSAWIVTRPGVDDFENNWFTSYYEEMTNVHINWTVGTGDDANQKLSLLMASGDYPGMVLNQWAFSGTEMVEYGSQGVLLDLNPLVDEWGLESKRVFNENPALYEMFVMPGGGLYTLPHIGQCYHCRSTGKLWVYQPWLDALGLDMPQTTDEFYEVLVAFRDQDPNGNGIADEIPLAGSARGWMTPVHIFLLNAFAYNDNSKRMLQDTNGNIVLSYDQPEWKEGLKWMNKLYEEGLILPESFTQGSDQLKQIGENPDIPILGMAPGGFPGTFSDLSNLEGRWIDYKAVPALEGPNGLRQTIYNYYPALTSGSSITDNVENEVIAFRWLEAFYNEELMMTKTFGEKDVWWRWAKTGELGSDGQQGVWAETTVNAQKPQNIHWSNVNMPMLMTEANHTGRVSDSPLERVLWEETARGYAPYYPEIARLVPPLVFDRDTGRELADIEGPLKSYVDEMIARFITGDANIDTEWDSYLEQLDNLGIDRLREIYQTALDAKK